MLDLQGQKIEKPQETSKNLNLLIKYFLTLLRSRPTLVPKYSPESYYIAQPSRKIPKRHILTLKMDPYYGPARVLYVTLLYSTHSISDFEGGRKVWPKITVPSAKRTKWAPPRYPQPVLRPKKYNSWSSGSKIQKTSKNLKKPQFTYKTISPLFPRPLNQYIKILPIGTLLKPAVEKTTKITHHDPQQTPSPFLRTLYISRFQLK